MLGSIYKILVVTSHVNAEIVDPHSRKSLDKIIRGGGMAALQINTKEEILEFQHNSGGGSIGRGEIDVILTCKKIASDAGCATGVLDDRAGRAAAKEVGIEFTVLIGLLASLRSHGALDESEYNDICDDLRSSKFRLPKGF